MIWGSNAYVTKYDIEVREKIRDIKDLNPRMREEWLNIYGDSVQSLWSGWIDAVRDMYEKRKDGDLCMEEAKRVKCPTLIVHGAKDVMRPQFHADYLKENIRGSEMVIMEEAKHNLHLKYAQEFNQLAERFLLK